MLADFVKILGQPYFQSPNCLIYHTDCLEGMLMMPDACKRSTHLNCLSS